MVRNILHFMNYKVKAMFKKYWTPQNNQPKIRKKYFSSFLASAGDLTQDLLVLSLLPCHLRHHASSLNLKWFWRETILKIILIVFCLSKVF